MNILMVTTFYPPHVGGIEYHVENLSKELVKGGHKITVLTSVLPKTDLSSNESSCNGVDIVRLKTFFPSGRLYSSLSSQGFSLNVQKTIKRLVKEKNIDLIHAHGHHYFLTWRAIDAAQKLGLPSVLTLHGLYALNPTDPLAQIEEELFNRTIFKAKLNKVTAIIGLTSKITDYAKKYGSPSKNYFTIPNGVNHQVFSINRKNRSIFRKKYNISNSKTVVLFRGRFATVKGVLELAETAKLVAKKNDQVFFLFVGGGPLKMKLARTLEPLKENYKIISWTSPDDIHELYLASDIFILPSKSEALPLTILEAMAANLYIVATPVGGVPEVLEKYRRKTFLAQNSPSDIRKTLLEAVARIHQSQDLSEINELECAAYFDWVRIASRVEAVYQHVKNHFFPANNGASREIPHLQSPSGF